MKILGIDPGLVRTGYGLIRSERGRVDIVEAGFIASPAGEKSSLEKRLQMIHEGVREIIGRARPDAVAVEQLYSHYAHPRTAIMMGHARGVMFLAAAECGVPVVGYSATQVKKSLTGNGRAGKGQVQRMVKNVLGLKEQPSPSDVADALAVALCHSNHSTRRSK
ncbi:MAG: crossover junction endodeoxyribonuclease RuvC [Planctomycetota bacterium]|nr:MAG: crossover junction endodeoxyribonuclease RuvC [Planctomycetota bacterium]